MHVLIAVARHSDYLPFDHICERPLTRSPQIMQGLAPNFIAGLSDGAGRRPAFAVSFIIYLGANIGLALQSNYGALLVLRLLQSAGSSSTVALGNAVVADIATTAERGLFISWVSSGQFLGKV